MTFITFIIILLSLAINIYFDTKPVKNTYIDMGYVGKSNTIVNKLDRIE